jgi:hypothetical protein
VRPYGAGDFDEHWEWRPVGGHAAVKTYRCPGCDHEIALGQPHVVAWHDEALDDRRHWHTACWRRFSRAT